MSIKQSNQKLQFTAPSAGYFPDEDMPVYIEKLQSMKINIERIPRDDLKYGNIVVILEGEFASKRVIYLGSKNFNAIVIGPRSFNGVPLIKIDEKYLLKTSTVLKLTKVEINEEDIFKSEKEFIENYTFFEPSALETKLEEEIKTETSKIEFMRAYLSEDFNLSDITKIDNMKF